MAPVLFILEPIMPLILAVLFISAINCYQDISPQEQKLREQLFKSPTPRKRSAATTEIAEYYAKSGLLHARAKDENLTIRLIALWQLGNRADNNMPQEVIGAIEKYTGLLPPKQFAGAIYGRAGYGRGRKQKTLMEGIDYAKSLDETKAYLDKNGSLSGYKDVLIVKEVYEEIVAHIFSLDGGSAATHGHNDRTIKNISACNDKYQIIILYTDDLYDYRGIIVLRDINANKLLWREVLYGLGNIDHPMVGPPVPRRFFCQIGKEYICIYGTGPRDVFMELFEIKTGKRVHSFCSNYRWRFENP